MKSPTTSTVFALPPTPLSSPSQALSSTDGLLPAWPQLHDTIILKASTAIAGQAPISGALIVVNSGDEAVNLSKGCRPSYMVVLANSRYAATVGWGGDCPGGPFLIHPGVNRLPFSILTTYLVCSEGKGTPSHPPCLKRDHMPPLPAGDYSAVLRGNGLALPAPPPVTVTLKSDG